MDRFGDILFNFYGATETGLVTLAKPEDLRAAPGTIGRAVPGNEIRLLDDAGREVPPARWGSCTRATRCSSPATTTTGRDAREHEATASSASATSRARTATAASSSRDASGT